MILQKRHYKLVVTGVITAVVFGGIFVHTPQVKAETSRDQLSLQIQKLLLQINSLQQRVAETQGTTNASVKNKTTVTRRNIPVIESSALIRLPNPSILSIYDGVDHRLSASESALFRWDASFDFDKTAICNVKLKYSDRYLYQTYRDTKNESARIGFYAQAVTEYGVLSEIGVNCKSDSETFSAVSEIEVYSPPGLGTFRASSGGEEIFISRKLSYSSALQKCLQSALKYQDDTICVWSGVTIANIKTFGEGIQPATAFFNLRK